MPKEQFDLAPASVQGIILGSGVILFDVGEFEHRIAHLNSNERVADVRSTAKVIADAKGLVKSSGLTKLNNRDVYLDTATGNLYAVDTQHGRFELTNSKGKHLGEVNFNFEPTKPADPSGRHNLNVR